MNRWPTKPLGEVASIQMGQSPPGETYNSGGVGLPFFQGKAEFGDEFPTAIKWCSQPSRIAEAGDILLSVRAPVGPSNYATERCCIGRGLAGIRGKPELCNQRFIRYYFKRFEADIAARGVGSTFAARGRSDIERLAISVPPLAEQERIMKLLDDADELWKLRTQADHRTTTLLPALFHEMFGDSKFKPVSVGELTSLVTSGATPRGGEEVYVTEGPYFIRSQNVQMNRLDLSDVVCLPAEVHQQMSRTKVATGDVLLNITGASIGRVAWVDKLDREANVSQHVCLIRPNPHLLNAAYLSVYVSLPATQRFILQVQAGASRQALNHRQVRALEIPLPRLLLQKDFARRVAEIRDLEVGQAASCRRFDELFQSLLHRAFEGEL